MVLAIRQRRLGHTGPGELIKEAGLTVKLIESYL